MRSRSSIHGTSAPCAQNTALGTQVLTAALPPKWSASAWVLRTKSRLSGPRPIESRKGRITPSGVPATPVSTSRVLSPRRTYCEKGRGPRTLSIRCMPGATSKSVAGLREAGVGHVGGSPLRRIPDKDRDHSNPAPGPGIVGPHPWGGPKGKARIFRGAETSGPGAGCTRGPCYGPTRGPQSRPPSRSGPASPRGPSRGRRETPRPPRGRRAGPLVGVRPDVALPPLEPDLYLAVLGHHLVGAEGDVGVGHAPAGGNVVLEAVPGTGHDLAFVDPLELPVPFGPGDEGAQGRLPFAQRPRLVRTQVRKAVQSATDVEDPDLAPPDLYHLVGALGKVRYGPHRVFVAPLLVLVRHPSPWVVAFARGSGGYRRGRCRRASGRFSPRP